MKLNVFNWDHITAPPHTNDCNRGALCTQYQQYLHNPFKLIGKPSQLTVITKQQNFSMLSSITAIKNIIGPLYFEQQINIPAPLQSKSVL